MSMIKRQKEDIRYENNREEDSKSYIQTNQNR